MDGKKKGRKHNIVLLNEHEKENIGPVYVGGGGGGGGGGGEGGEGGGGRGGDPPPFKHKKKGTCL